MSDWDDLHELLVECDAPVTFSAYCRSGLVGDMCRCWRCRGLKHSDHGSPESDASAREAQLIDRAYREGVGFGRLCERAK